MTLLADRRAVPAAPHGMARPGARRLWEAPPRWHLLGLALLLVVLIPVVGTGSSFSSDEGAAIVQARSLAAGEGWIVPHPLPAADPDGRHYPLVNSERGERGFAPFAKHPAYAVALAGAYRAGGVAAMVLLSLAGVVVAAGLAGALAARFDPALRRPAIWTVGLASPLFFDGFLVMGHTLGAAFAAGAVLAAVVAVADRRPVVALAVAPCIAGAVLVRSEAALFAAALAVVVLAVAGTTRARAALGARRRPAAPAAVAAGAAVAGVLVARLVEAAWLVRIVGDGASSADVSGRYGAAGAYLADRAEGFQVTWLLPDYQVSQPFSVLLVVMAAALVMGAAGARPAAPARRILAPAALAAVAAMAALAIGPTTVVPGLLVAFPLLAAGLASLRRPVFAAPGAALAAGTAGAFALAVIATQYPSGGTGEWGGRYFALAVPVIVPVVLLALHRQAGTLAAGARRGALAALVACSVALSTMALLSVRESHRYWSGVLGSVEEAGAVAGAGAPVIATWSAAPRYAWPILDQRPWLVTSTADIGRLRRSIADLGFDRFVFLTVDLDADRAALAGLDVVWSDGPLDGGRSVLVVRESGAGAR